MNLTKDDKEALKSLLIHPGFKVLEKLEEDARVNIGTSMLTSDLSNEKLREELTKKQIYCQARADFLANVKANSMEVYIPSI